MWDIQDRETQGVKGWDIEPSTLSPGCEELG